MDYTAINKDLWNKWAALHVDSKFYDNDAFKKGKSSLNKTELDLLGDVKGKKILHLQCHFGQDSISFARLGAQVTGVDMSEKGIEIAQKMAQELNIDMQFVCCNVLELDQHLKGEFDIVFTSYGTIGWLPDLHQWGKIVSHFLKPNGQFLIVEFHPLINMYEDNFQEIKYSYFKNEVVVLDEAGSYANPDAKHVKAKSASWDYSLSEVFMALINHGLKIENFQEYDFSHYDIFEDSVPNKNGFQIKGLEGRMPLMFSILAKKF